MGDKSGVRAASSTSIQISFCYQGVRCRERIKQVPTPQNLRNARALKGRIDNEIARNEFDYRKHFPDSPRAKRFVAMPGDAITFRDYLGGWLETERARIKHSTWIGYQKILKYHLIPAFGVMLLTDMRRKHIYAWADKHSDLSAKRVRNVLSPLRIALDAAVERELIAANPLNDFKLKRRAGRSEDVDPFSADERTAILAAMSAIDPQVHNLVQFAFWTGLRTSELVALDWSDIDWIRGVVRVSRTLTQGMTQPEDGTKTKAGAREVTLLAPALAALTAQKQHTFIKGAEVFQRPRLCERWTGDQAIRDRVWIPALKKAGVRYRNPYQTRHTYASMMLMAGENVMWVARQMGHTDWSLTAKRYSRWIPSDMPDAGSKAVALWTVTSRAASAVGRRGFAQRKAPAQQKNRLPSGIGGGE